MPKKQDKAAGPRPYDAAAYLDEDIEALWKPPAHWPVWSQLAKEHLVSECRRILNDAGIDFEDHCLHHISLLDDDGSLEWLASRLLSQLEEVELAIVFQLRRAGLSDPGITIISNQLKLSGRLEERMFWRFGVDPVSGTWRELLAKRGRDAIVAGRSGGAHNAAKAAKTQAIIRQLAEATLSKRKKPPSEREMSRLIQNDWPDDEPVPSEEAIRRHLREIRG